MVGAPPCALKRSAAAGGALLSHGAAPAVPSALAGLTSGFGMGPGVPPPPRPPADAAQCPRSPRARPGALRAARRSPSRGRPRPGAGPRPAAAEGSSSWVAASPRPSRGVGVARLVRLG